MSRRVVASSLTLVLVAVLAPIALASTAYAKHPPRTTTTTTPSTTTSTTTTSPTTTSSTTTTTTTVPSSGPIVGGYDIAWPQCSSSFPKNPAFGIVGVSDGLAYSDNPCLANQYAWAAQAPHPPGFYMNTADPGSQSVHWTAPGPKACSGSSSDLGCAYNYGWNAASHAFAYTNAQTGAAANVAWWLDIETTNTWSTNVSANNADIQGVVDYFHAQSVPVGVYSSKSQWTTITSGFALDVPNWLAGASSATQASSWCSASSFTGGPVTVVQYPSGSYDGDLIC